MLLYCLSICTRNVLLLRAQIIRKAKEEAAVSHQVLSSPVLPGDSLCSAASRSFSLSCTADCSIFPSFCSTVPCSSMWTLGPLSAWHLEHPDSPSPGSAAYFFCSPHPRTLLSQSRFRDAPQLGKGSILFHILSSFWAQSLLIPRMAATISFQLARNFSLSSSFHIPFPKGTAEVWKW